MENEMKRTILPRKKTLRRELECYVVAWNKVLKDVVRSMDIITLLRNAHPSYRDSFVRQLMEVGMITKFDASEFTKVLGPKYSQYN